MEIHDNDPTLRSDPSWGDPKDNSDRSTSPKGAMEGHDIIQIENVQYSDGKFHATAKSMGRIFHITVTGIPKESPEQFEAFLEKHTVTMIQVASVKGKPGKPTKFKEAKEGGLLSQSSEHKEFKTWNLHDKQMKYAEKLHNMENPENTISDHFDQKGSLLHEIRTLANSQDESEAMEHFHRIAFLAKGTPVDKISSDEQTRKIIKKALLYSEAEAISNMKVGFIDSAREKADDSIGNSLSSMRNPSSMEGMANKGKSKRAHHSVDILEAKSMLRKKQVVFNSGQTKANGDSILLSKRGNTIAIYFRKKGETVVDSGAINNEIRFHMSEGNKNYEKGNYYEAYKNYFEVAQLYTLMDKDMDSHDVKDAIRLMEKTAKNLQ